MFSENLISYGGYILYNLIKTNYTTHFEYSFSVTSTSLSICDKVIHFQLTVSTAKLLSSMKQLIRYTYWRWSKRCRQLQHQQFGESNIKTLTSDLDPGALLTPELSREVENFTINNYA